MATCQSITRVYGLSDILSPRNIRSYLGGLGNELAIIVPDTTVEEVAVGHGGLLSNRISQIGCAVLAMPALGFDTSLRKHCGPTPQQDWCCHAA